MLRERKLECAGGLETSKVTVLDPNPIHSRNLHLESVNKFKKSDDFSTTKKKNTRYIIKSFSF